MRTELSPQSEQFIQQAVEIGIFNSRAQLLNTAVDLLNKRLKQMIQEGIDQLDRGEGIPAEEVFAKLERKAKAIVRRAQQR
jgi:antitoxin ParD1/3/4